MQIKLLHDRRDAFGADPDATFGQSDANFFGAESLGAVIKNLLYQPEHHPYFELFCRNTGGFLCGKP